MKQLRLRLVVLTLMAGLLVPATAFARVLSICNMGGRTAKACCCHKGAKKSASCKTPAIDREACCRTLVSHAEKASATHSSGFGDVPPAALLERMPALSYFALLASEAESLAPRARGPPPVGPPLFLRDCRILS